LLREKIHQALTELSKISPKDLVDQRYEKYRKMGSFFSEGA
jgi:acetyl-CoA carboxylase alpha subunit